MSNKMRHSPLAPEEQNAVKDFCHERGITEVIHFTPLENLSTIHQHRSLFTSELRAQNVDDRRTDSNRNDVADHAVRLSISFPNYKMFYKKSRSSPSQVFVVLSLQPQLLWELPCYFCPTNAAKREISLLLQQDPSQFVGLEALRKLFADEAMTPNGVIKRADLKIPPHYVTDSQAEVLCYCPIPSDFIQAIYIRADDSEARERIPSEWQRLVVHNNDYFGPRSDYKHWSSQGTDSTGSQRVMKETKAAKAKRIVFQINNQPPFFKEHEVEFQWTKGLRREAVEANAKALREAAVKHLGTGSRVFEISRAGSDYSCFSAFRLHVCIDPSHNLPLEVVFQSAKVWQNTEPTDLLTVDLEGISGSRKAKKVANNKRDEKVPLAQFSLKVGEVLADFPLEPHDAFYNWLYIVTLRQPHNRDWVKRLIAIADDKDEATVGFTDVHYIKKNKKRIRYNCQARAVAIFVSLYKYKRDMIDSIIPEFKDLRSLLKDEPSQRFDEFVKSVYNQYRNHSINNLFNNDSSTDIGETQTTAQVKSRVQSQGQAGGKSPKSYRKRSKSKQPEHQHPSLPYESTSIIAPRQNGK